MSTVPLVLCGLTAEVGGRVAASLKPEYEVIQFLTSVADAKAGIPDLLACSAPKSIAKANAVGSHDFSRPPQAVLFGRGFGPAEVEEIRGAVGDAAVRLAWVQSTAEGRAELAAQMDTQTRMPLDPAAYGRSVTASVKALLSQLQAGGKLGGGGVHFY